MSALAFAARSATRCAAGVCFRSLVCDCSPPRRNFVLLTTESQAEKKRQGKAGLGNRLDRKTVRTGPTGGHCAQGNALIDGKREKCQRENVLRHYGTYVGHIQGRGPVRVILLETALLTLEAGTGECRDGGWVFRAIHTIKGSGAMAGFARRADSRHGPEEAFDLRGRPPGDHVGGTDRLRAERSATSSARFWTRKAKRETQGGVVTEALSRLLASNLYSNPDHSAFIDTFACNPALSVLQNACASLPAPGEVSLSNGGTKYRTLDELAPGATAFAAQFGVRFQF